MKTLIIDNYDSFTFNLYQQIAEVNGIAPVVIKNDEMNWDELVQLSFDNIVISPGPGRPEVAEDFGLCADAILKAEVPLLGVCLGHQGICHLFGGNVDYAAEVMHGRASDVYHTNEGLFKHVPSPLSVIRYHSLYVSDIPPTFKRTAWTEDQMVMGVQHIEKPIYGVQFHPESICTEYGHQILDNFSRLTERFQERNPIDRRVVDDGVSAATNKANANGESTHFYLDNISSEKALLHESPFKIHYRRLPLKLDPEQVFMNCFADANPSFWLDSALVRGFSRFSYMGDALGPHAEYVQYSAQEKSLQVTYQGSTETLRTDIFSYLEKMLEERKTHIEGLPFDFNLGYVGYLGYELKSECGGSGAHQASTPDAAFVFADRMIVFDHEEGVSYLLCLDDTDNSKRAEDWLSNTWTKLHNLEPIPPWSRALHPEELKPEYRHTPQQYFDLVQECQDEIRRGESYEICLTNMITSKVDIDPFNTYRALRSNNPAPYATYFSFGDVSMLGSSPERFITVDDNGLVESKPIKGTRKRGKTTEEDEELYHDLRINEKDRSENLMIVDLLRNDIGKVSEVGSVHVAKMFAVETYATVHQLVSTVRGKLRKGVSAVGCVRATFPGGSMTGAPKVRTMEIIDRLEKGPRGLYSGATGYFGLNGSTDLSITIRTIVVTPEETTIGVGGAIIALSDPQEEVDEMLLKSQATVKAVSETVLHGPENSQLVGEL